MEKQKQQNQDNMKNTENDFQEMNDITENQQEPSEVEPEIKEKAESLQEEETENNYLEQLQRLQAEFLNYKKRTEQRMKNHKEMQTRDIVSQLLPVIDDFDILFTHSKDESNDSISLDGIRMIYNKLLDTLGEMGLEPIEAEGEPFDPEYHEAVLTEESDQAEEGTILKVWQNGFKFRDALLRPAKVVTAKEKQDDTNEPE